MHRRNQNNEDPNREFGSCLATRDPERCCGFYLRNIERPIRFEIEDGQRQGDAFSQRCDAGCGIRLRNSGDRLKRIQAEQEGEERAHGNALEGRESAIIVQAVKKRKWENGNGKMVGVYFMLCGTRGTNRTLDKEMPGTRPGKVQQGGIKRQGHLMSYVYGAGVRRASNNGRI